MSLLSKLMGLFGKKSEAMDECCNHDHGHDEHGHEGHDHGAEEGGEQCDCCATGEACDCGDGTCCK